VSENIFEVFNNKMYRKLKNKTLITQNG
jgi:hypothetical protein